QFGARDVVFGSPELGQVFGRERGLLGLLLFDLANQVDQFGAPVEGVALLLLAIELDDGIAHFDTRAGRDQIDDEQRCHRPLQPRYGDRGGLHGLDGAAQPNDRSSRNWRSAGIGKTFTCRTARARTYQEGYGQARTYPKPPGRTPAWAEPGRSPRLARHGGSLKRRENNP